MALRRLRRDMLLNPENGGEYRLSLAGFDRSTAFHEASNLSIGRVRAAKSLQSSVNNVFQVAEFAGPLTIGALLGRMRPQTILVGIQRHFFKLRLECVRIANGESELLECAD